MKPTALAVLALSAFGAAAQAAPQLGVTSDHAPNAETVACLEALTADCAIDAALKTVIAEELGIDRARVLIGVARSLIAAGQQEQAQQTLMLAMEEARSVQLSLVTQGMIKTIAPLMVRAGDMASALALTEELTIETIRDQVYLALADEAGHRGAYGDIKVALSKLANPARGRWKMIDLMLILPKEALLADRMSEAIAFVGSLDDPKEQYRGLVALAALNDKLGDTGTRDALMVEAGETFQAVFGINDRAEASAQALKALVTAGADESLISAAYDLALMHGGRVRSREDRADIDMALGPVEAANGHVDTAFKRLEGFDEGAGQAGYLAAVATRLPQGENRLMGSVNAVLDDIDEIDGAYDRDQMRLTLLDGLVAGGHKAPAEALVKRIEDDDSQALGLALLAPML
ncbi:hypothetical protein [Gimibacter soli]|uniref:HEAT repeat domain-containing protein n=1 Tax=Gimibacter soli TaxID=3024400 RepID=A0AAE9XQP1_9PROT|nr:hypothetical protein [Gimibacter soli]WCL55437.1 hypothetical protein PH603_06650 [Gimibacter soli]